MNSYGKVLELSENTKLARIQTKLLHHFQLLTLLGTHNFFVKFDSEVIFINFISESYLKYLEPLLEDSKFQKMALSLYVKMSFCPKI